ncbi:2'-5' RNA ligase [Bradyrhizobium sp. LM3.2]
MPRLFTGLEIPAEIGQSLSNLRGGLPGARWIDPENYHVTLRFIGNIDGMSANEIASMLFRVDRKPFEVKVQGLQSFGGRKPRAVVATIVPSKPLMELQAELERMMQRIGLDPEGRKFIPHVTLARLQRRHRPRCRRLSLAARLFSQQGVHGRTFRAVLLARLHRRRSLCGRGRLRVV